MGEGNPYYNKIETLSAYNKIIGSSKGILYKINREIDKLKEIFSDDEIKVIRHLVTYDIDIIKKGRDKLEGEVSDEEMEMWREMFTSGVFE